MGINQNQTVSLKNNKHLNNLQPKQADGIYIMNCECSNFCMDCTKDFKQCPQHSVTIDYCIVTEDINVSLKIETHT